MTQKRIKQYRKQLAFYLKGTNGCIPKLLIKQFVKERIENERATTTSA